MKKLQNRFYKVNERGGSYVTATFFNPITKESFERVVYDYDDVRVEMDAGVLYSMSIDDEVRSMWLHHRGIIQVGDLVQINRGRKFKGEQKRVKKEFTFIVDGTYGHGDVEYLVFEDGTKVAKHNCDLVKEYERYGFAQ